MSTLTGRTIADSYKELLKTSSTTGLSSSLVTIEDGDATVSALSLSTTAVYSSGALQVAGLSTLNSLTVSSTSVFSGLAAFTQASIASGSIANSVVINKSPVITLAGDLSGSVTLTDLGSGTLTATISSNSTTLGTDTTGNYVATIAGTANEISVAGSGSETANVTLSLPTTLSFAGKTITDLGSVTSAQINGGTINGTSVGATTPSTGSFSQATLANQGQLRFSELTANGVDYVALQSPTTIASSYTITLPSANGAAGYALITDGSGNLTWQNPYGGGATNTIGAGDSSLTVADPGTGTITGSIDGVNRIVVNSTGVAITGTLSVSGAISGTASSANTLSTSRNFSVTGDVTAPTISFNGSGDVALASTLGTGVVNNTNVGASAAIAFSKLASLTSGNILVGSAANVPTSVAMSGDATIANNGAVTIANNAITNAKVSSSAAIDFSKLGALTTGQIVAGNAGVATATTLGGDATIGATGTLTIANDAITTAKILNGAVTLAKIDPAAISSFNQFHGFRLNGTHLIMDYGSGTWLKSDYRDSMFAPFTGVAVNAFGHLIGTF